MKIFSLGETSSNSSSSFSLCSMSQVSSTSSSLSLSSSSGKIGRQVCEWWYCRGLQRNSVIEGVKTDKKNTLFGRFPWVFFLLSFSLRMKTLFDNLKMAPLRCRFVNLKKRRRRHQNRACEQSKIPNPFLFQKNLVRQTIFLWSRCFARWGAVSGAGGRLSFKKKTSLLILNRSWLNGMCFNNASQEKRLVEHQGHLGKNCQQTKGKENVREVSSILDATFFALGRIMQDKAHFLLFGTATHYGFATAGAPLCSFAGYVLKAKIPPRSEPFRRTAIFFVTEQVQRVVQRVTEAPFESRFIFQKAQVSSQKCFLSKVVSEEPSFEKKATLLLNRSRNSLRKMMKSSRK